MVLLSLKIKKLLNQYPDEPDIRAVFQFLSSPDFSTVYAHPTWKECIKIPGCNLSFVIEGQMHLVCENEQVKEFLADAPSQAGESDDEDDEDLLPESEGLCLISGETVPLARLHPRTPIPGAKSNAKIVSFQKNMGFDSYGKKQSYNAPTGQQAAFAYTTALNYLLARKSRQKLAVGDATTVFWSDQYTVMEDIFGDLFGGSSKENPEQQHAAIRMLYTAPEHGVPPLKEDYKKFYVLGLAPNAARIAIRFWHAGTVGETARQILQHFADCAIVHGPKQPEYLSLFRLLVNTAALGKSENILPNLAGDFMKAILSGTPYPQSALAAVVMRIRAEQSKNDPNGNAVPNVSYPRVALIKAILCRENRIYQRYQKEVEMSLDFDNVNIGYRLGRLFAVLEKIQEEANPGINTTIRDRFYGAASGIPVAAFPQLMKLKNHHLSKLENRGRAVNLERMLGEIFVGIDDFPAHLSLQDQGRFAVGYYHATARLL